MHITSSLHSLLLLASMAAVWSEATPILIQPEQESATPSLRGLIVVGTSLEFLIVSVASTIF
jgi:hypothetical protein